jgi:hypothetical protein
MLGSGIGPRPDGCEALIYTTQSFQIAQRDQEISKENDLNRHIEMISELRIKDIFGK